MNRAIVATALLGLGVAAGPAFAQENEQGFYAGGGLGQFNVDLDGVNSIDRNIRELDADDTSWKIFAGYRFNPYIAVEAAYIDFGRPEDEFRTGGSSGDYSVELNGFAPYLIGTLPVGPVELFAKVGYYIYDIRFDVDIDSPLVPDVDQRDSGNDFMYGVGVGLTLAQQLNLRLEYEEVDADVGRFGANANAFWLSGAWRF